MAKENEKKIARILYVEQGKTGREISELLSVSEKTISAWVNDGAWKSAQNARITSPQKRIENIKEIIGSLAERRIALGRELDEFERNKDLEAASEKRKEISQIDDAVSKWNKTLKDLDAENKISLSAYLKIMDEIFEAIRHFDEKQYYGLLKFQEFHLNEISNRLS